MLILSCSDILAKHTYIYKLEPKTLYFKFNWLLQNRFPFSISTKQLTIETTNYWSLSVSRAASQLIMPRHKPTFAYKLALQLDPRDCLVNKSKLSFFTLRFPLQFFVLSFTILFPPQFFNFPPIIFINIFLSSIFYSLLHIFNDFPLLIFFNSQLHNFNIFLSSIFLFPPPQFYYFPSPQFFYSPLHNFIIFPPHSWIPSFSTILIFSHLRHVKEWLNFWSWPPAKIKLFFFYGHAF